MNSEPRPPTRRQRFPVLAVFALFLGPVVAAWVIFHYLPQWQPKGTVNHGELVRPARPLTAVPPAAVDGSSLTDDLVRGRWTLLAVVEGTCDETCQRRLYELRQLHTALNKDVARVRRVLLVIDPVANADFAGLAAAFPDLHLARGRAETLAKWLAQFDMADGVAPARSGRVFLIDPLGNLMMFYAPDSPAKGILRDLERLLKISQIG